MMKISLIPDSEIVLNSKNDILGTRPYSNTIISTVNDSTGKLTIGLFGSYGTGKTSIVKTVLNEFDKTPEKYFTFYYDSWKYKNNSFKRTFLIELAIKLNQNLSKLSKRLYNSVEREERTSSKNYDWIINLAFFSPLLIPLLAILHSFINGNFSNAHVAVVAIGIVYSILFKVLEGILKKDIIKVKDLPIFSPEQFDKLYLNLFNEGKTYEKYIIVIDNIDRCEPELMKELLSSIKGFLEHEKVIFMVPIDDESLRKFLNLNDAEFNQLQRKIFSSTLKLRPFTDLELIKFAEHLNEAFDLNFSSEVLDISTSIYSRNPRKIIQFLNTLQSELFLITEQERTKNLLKNTLSDNKEGLAKLVAIREEWSDLYQEVKNNINFFHNINSYIRDLKFENDFDYPENKPKVKIDREKYNFLKRTINISTQGYKYFFMNKAIIDTSDESLMRNILQRNWEVINNSIELGRTDSKKIIQILEKLIITEIDQKDNSISALVILEFILSQVRKTEEGFIHLIFNEENSAIVSFINSYKIVSKNFPQIDKELLIESILKLLKVGASKNIFISKYLQIVFKDLTQIELPEDIAERLKQIRNELLFRSKELEELELFQHGFIEKYKKNFEVFINYEDCFSSPYKYFSFLGEHKILESFPKEKLDFGEFKNHLANIENLEKLFLFVRLLQYCFRKDLGILLQDWYPFFSMIVQKMVSLEYKNKSGLDKSHNEEHIPLINIISGIEKTIESNNFDEKNPRLVKSFTDDLRKIYRLKFCEPLNMKVDEIIKKYDLHLSESELPNENFPHQVA